MAHSPEDARGCILKFEAGWMVLVVLEPRHDQSPLASSLGVPWASYRNQRTKYGPKFFDVLPRLFQSLGRFLAFGACVFKVAWLPTHLLWPWTVPTHGCFEAGWWKLRCESVGSLRYFLHGLVWKDKRHSGSSKWCKQNQETGWEQGTLGCFKGGGCWDVNLWEVWSISCMV